MLLHVRCSCRLSVAVALSCMVPLSATQRVSVLCNAPGTGAQRPDPRVCWLGVRVSCSLWLYVTRSALPGRSAISVRGVKGAKREPGGMRAGKKYED